MDEDGGVDSWAIGEYSEVISMLEAAAAAAAAPRVMGGALLSPHPHRFPSAPALISCLTHTAPYVYALECTM